MPRVINTYIFKEVSVPFLLSLAILTVTAFLSKVIKLVELMITGGAGLSFALRFIVSVAPSLLIYTIPVSFLIAVLVAFTRLSSDSEITAMKASGMSLFTVMRPVATLAVMAYAVTLAFTLYLFPLGNLNLKALLSDVATSKLLSGIEEKTFYDRFKGMVLYVDRLSPSTGEVYGIFIAQGGRGGESTIFFAKKGVFAEGPGGSSAYLRLYDGTMHKKNDSDASYYLANFSSYTLELGGNSGAAGAGADKSDRELYPGELIGRIKEMKSKGKDASALIIDLHKRFALPASVFIYMLLGVPLGIQKVRSARFTGFGIALGVALAYYVASTALESLGEVGVLNPVVSVWGSDAIFGAAGLYIFYMAAKDSPVHPASWLMAAGNGALGRGKKRARQ